MACSCCTALNSFGTCVVHGDGGAGFGWVLAQVGAYVCGLQVVVGGVCGLGWVCEESWDAAGVEVHQRLRLMVAAWRLSNPVGVLSKVLHNAA